jgi:hypothetical protein
VRHTYGVGSLVEAGIHAGIDQARHQPSQWQEGATGYAERFGSAAGEIIVRGTTESGFGEIFREDLRLFRDPGTPRFTAALEDTFTARRGSDGTPHSRWRALSGRFQEALWPRPGSRGTCATKPQRGFAITYGLVFVRNLISS